jgi:hypothetical protein
MGPYLTVVHDCVYEGSQGTVMLSRSWRPSKSNRKRRAVGRPTQPQGFFEDGHNAWGKIIIRSDASISLKDENSALDLSFPSVQCGLDLSHFSGRNFLMR